MKIPFANLTRFSSRINLSRILPFFAGVSLLGLPRETVAAPQTTIFHAEIISLPEATAELLLTAPEIKTNPGATLEQLHGLISRREAASIANATARSKIGERGVIQGRLSCEWQIVLEKDNTYSVLVRVKSGEDEIFTTLKTTPGEVVFLGIFDPTKPLGSNGETEAYFVFLRIQ